MAKNMWYVLSEKNYPVVGNGLGLGLNSLPGQNTGHVAQYLFPHTATPYQTNLTQFGDGLTAKGRGTSSAGSTIIANGGVIGNYNEQYSHQ